MTDQNENVLIYMCPESSRVVVTGVSADDWTLKRLAGLKFSMWCPHCATAHVIAGKEASVVIVRAGAREPWDASAASITEPLSQSSETSPQTL